MQWFADAEALWLFAGSLIISRAMDVFVATL
jgi:hypothetical protein